MDLHDIVFSALAAATVASLAWLGLLQAHKHKDRSKDEGKTDRPIDSAAVDMVVLAAIVTFIAMMVARHPEWVS